MNTFFQVDGSVLPIHITACTILLILSFVAWTTFKYVLWSGHTQKPLEASGSLKHSEASWEYPPVSPDLDFDLEKTSPPAFQVFRSSYKRHVIEVKKLDLNTWILLDNDFPRYHQAKVARLADRGDKIVGTLPHAREAARELCQDLAEYLSRRYPQVYRVSRLGKGIHGWFGEGEISRIEIPAIGASYDLTKEDPMTVAGLIQPTDLNILLKMDDGQYHHSAAMFGIGGGQRLKDKIGKCLADLHLEAHIPHYTEQLQSPLDRFLGKLKVESPIVRYTHALSIHDEFHWPEITMGPEDDWDPALRGPGVGTPSYGIYKPPRPVTDISNLFFRQERQTLRRLPKSKAVVWSVHTYVVPLASMLDKPGVPERLASLIRSWDDELAAHKGRHLYEGFLLPYLDELHTKQVEAGVWK